LLGEKKTIAICKNRRHLVMVFYRSNTCARSDELNVTRLLSMYSIRGSHA